MIAINAINNEPGKVIRDITLNPTQMAEDMKRNNGFIPGVKPGKDTAEYIDTVMSRITLPGSLFIAFIAIMPALAGLLDVQQAFSQFFGGTSLLILLVLSLTHYNKSRVICLCATMMVF